MKLKLFHLNYKQASDYFHKISTSKGDYTSSIKLHITNLHCYAKEFSHIISLYLEVKKC